MDKRNHIRAHYPPRRVNVVTVQLNRDDYERIYKLAVNQEISLADAIRQLIKNNS